jgi:hypothetical protein
MDHLQEFGIEEFMNDVMCLVYNAVKMEKYGSCDYIFADFVKNGVFYS